MMTWITPVKVLIISEDENDFNLLKTQFSTIPRSHNYVLYWCNSYEKAINAMLKSQYDIYLVYYPLDLSPGYDLLNEAVKSNVAEPIIIVSDSDDFTKDQEALEKGASAYLLKDGLDALSLERTIRYVMHQKKLMRQMKESELRFRTIFEKSPDPIVITDSSGNIVDVNSACEKFFGVPRIKFLKNNAIKFYKNSSDRTALISEIEQKGTVSNFIVDLIAAEDAIKRCSISSFIQISQHGNDELFHTVIHDISRISTAPIIESFG